MKIIKNKLNFGLILIIICISLMGLLYINSLINKQKEQLEIYLYEISKKESEIIYQNNNNNFDNIKNIFKSKIENYKVINKIIIYIILFIFIISSIYILYTYINIYKKINNKIKNKIKKDINNALKNKEFIIYIQPKYNTKTEKIIGGEALIRWNKNNEIIYPNKFIPILEENNFIKNLDLYILENICKKQKEWLEKKYIPIKISINQSKKNLYDVNYINEIKNIIKKYLIISNLIEIELTENIFIENTNKIIELEKELHKLNVSIAMDDFGVGYSSYELLQKINIEVLKLDKSLFNNISNNKKAKTVIKYIIKMTKELNITTVAEGIETKEQVDFLKQVDCDEIQGYYFSKPIPIEEFEKLIRNK